MPPDAMTDAACSAIDAAYAADGSADDDDVAWSEVSVDAADDVDGDDANAEEVNVCPLLWTWSTISFGWTLATETSQLSRSTDTPGTMQ